MGKFKDLSGLRFGRLLVIKRIGTYLNKQGMPKKVLWECMCDCGKSADSNTWELVSGQSKSCGCLKKDIGIQKRIGSKNITGVYWGSIAHGAKIRDIPFNLTLEYAQKLLEEQKFKCALSGILLIADIDNSVHYGKSTLNTLSLDRIDSNLGYIEGNVQWVHKDLNWMKNSFHNTEFINWCRLVSDNNIPKPKLISG